MNIKPYMIIEIVDTDFFERFSNIYETIEKDSKYNLSYNLMEGITCGHDYTAYYFDREQVLRSCIVNLYSITINEDEDIYEVIFTVDKDSFALIEGTDFQISLYKYAFYFLPKLGLNGERIRVKCGFKQDKNTIVFYDEYDKSGKHLHTVSLYFQGGILENTFAERIYEGVKKSIEGLDNWMDVQMIYDDKDASCRVRIVFNEPE